MTFNVINHLDADIWHKSRIWALKGLDKFGMEGYSMIWNFGCVLARLELL